MTDVRRRRWDPVVRLTHWLIVAGVVVNALVTEEGSSPHVWVGYVIASTLALRLIWGVMGPAEARFSAFPPSPRRVLAHLGDIAAGRSTEHPSHNPLGALMVYAIWGTLAAIVVSGIIMAAPGGGHDEGGAARAAAVTFNTPAVPDDDEGDEAQGHEDEAESPLAELHEVAVNLLYVLIVLHIAGVAFETRRSGRHILMAMLPGRRLPSSHDGQAKDP